MPPADHDLDLFGLKCPLPALKTEKFLKALAPGATVAVRCSDPLSVIDIPNLLARTGDALLDQSAEGEEIRFLIRKAGG